MSVLIRKIISFPLYFLLFPLFFIAEKFNRYSGLIGWREAAAGFLYISGGLAFLCLLLYFMVRDWRKASLITTLPAIIFLYFGDIKNEFSKTEYTDWLSRYRFYLPLIAILTGVIILRVITSGRNIRLTLFLNLLFFLFIIREGWIFLQAEKHSRSSGNILKEDTISLQEPLSGSERYPDIYYIVPDCYPSGLFQKEMLGRNNDDFDNDLRQKGFYVVKHPASNYNRTAFSMAATFSMNYLDWLNKKGSVAPADYTRALRLIRKAPLMPVLKKSNYRMYNLSIFDLDTVPALKKENFLSLPPRMLIFYNSAWQVLRRDFFIPRHPHSPFSPAGRKDFSGMKTKYEPLKKFNREILDSLFALAGEKKDHPPFFLYAHLYLPHFPYFYDSSGRAYPADSIYNDSLITDRDKFSGYIQYTNMKILSLLDTIFKNGRDNKIVILQSDHGIADFDFSRRTDAFRNYSAIFFPDQDYSRLHDSISNVNTFRVILNKYFGYRLPLLKDSSFFLNN